MKFLTSDFIFVSTTAVVITTCSVLLYADFNRKIDAGNLKQIGTITFKKEVAQRKYQTQVVWEDVEQNFPVYNNDAIRTSDLSEAVIHLNDGTEINIDENTMIVLAALENAININFEHGSISASRGAGATGADIYAVNIKSLNTTVSIDKGNIQLSQSGGQGLDLKVSDGEAKVLSGDAETIVKANEKAIIAPDLKETKVQKLNFILKEPQANRYIITGTTQRDVNFQWDVEGKFKDIKLQISSDRAFAKILKTASVSSQKNVSFKLSEGTYFWRIVALNEDTKKTEVSDTAKFNIVYKKAPRIVSPTNNESLETAGNLHSIFFRWADSENSGNYILEISNDNNFANVIHSINTPLQSIAVDNLSSGKYFARVKSTLSISGENFEFTSPIISFNVEKQKEIFPPKLLSPGYGAVLDADILKSKGIVLSWSSDKSFKAYNVQIAKSDDFNQVLLSEQRSVNFMDLPKSLDKGKYFWRVQAVVSETENTSFSKSSAFELVEREKLVTLSPKNGEAIKVPADRTANMIKFMWNKIPDKGTYSVIIANNPEFTKPRVINFKEESSGDISIPESGQYYWRVILRDSKGREIQKSEVSNFLAEVEKPVEKPKTFLVVVAPVRGAKIYINEKFKGYGNVKLEVNPEDKVNVRIVATEFKEFTTTLKVPEGEVYTLRPAMEKSKLLQRIKWVNPLSSPLSSAPVYNGEKIIACSENGNLTVMTEEGGILFSKKIASGIESRPAIFNNNAYIVDTDGVLHSVSIQTGKINWSVKTGGPVLFKSEPLATKDMIFIATSKGIIEAYDHSGKKIWSKDYGESVYNTPQIYGELLIFATDELNLYAVNVKNGRKKWETEIDGRVITAAPLILNNYIYFGCYSGTFYSLDADDGDIMWTYKTGGPIFSSPVAFNKSIMFGSGDGFIYSLEVNTGKLLWSFKTLKSVKVSPIVAFGNLIIADEYNVYAINPSNGALVWQSGLTGKVKTSPVMISDGVVLGLQNGEVVSVRNSIVQVVK
jgi:outer membrane protein assembly factor BamB